MLDIIFYHSLYSILDFDWLIHLQITACKYRSAANNCNLVPRAWAWRTRSFNQRFHFEGNFLLKGFFWKMKEMSYPEPGPGAHAASISGKKN